MGLFCTNYALKMRDFLDHKSWDYMGRPVRRKIHKDWGWEAARAEVEGEEGTWSISGSPLGTPCTHSDLFTGDPRNPHQVEIQSLRGCRMSQREGTWPLWLKPGTETSHGVSCLGHSTSRGRRDQKAGAAQSLPVRFCKGDLPFQESCVTSNLTSISSQIQFCSH